MSERGPDDRVSSVTSGYDAMTPIRAHACNCIGCCRKCGTCRTWAGHTPEFCALLVKQYDKRMALRSESRAELEAVNPREGKAS